VVYAVDQERKAENIGKEDEFLRCVRLDLSIVPRGYRYETYLSNIGAYLADRRQELDCCHPFMVAKSGLSCIVV